MASEHNPLSRICDIVERLRDPVNGCDWDRVQTFETIAPFTIEEAYEVADAIARDDQAAIKDELGDLLFQILLHARIAEQAGQFSFDDVATAIADKMERRHPHIFGDADARPDWEGLKAAERLKARASSALDGVALALPALMRAEKLQKRAARTGFDWPDAEGPRAKIVEELAEVAAAESDDAREDEVGDLLFAAVNLARHLNIDPEVALRRANAKFERRFRAIETADGFSALPLADKEALWTAAKAAQRI
jgi:nucleoside triphosphate diphosphatase